jgi:hypothetical protein
MVETRKITKYKKNKQKYYKITLPKKITKKLNLEPQDKLKYTIIGNNTLYCEKHKEGKINILIIGGEYDSLGIKPFPKEIVEELTIRKELHFTTINNALLISTNKKDLIRYKEIKQKKEYILLQTRILTTLKEKNERDLAQDTKLRKKQGRLSKKEYEINTKRAKKIIEQITNKNLETEITHTKMIKRKHTQLLNKRKKRFEKEPALVKKRDERIKKITTGLHEELKNIDADIEYIKKSRHEDKDEIIKELQKNKEEVEKEAELRIERLKNWDVV